MNKNLFNKDLKRSRRSHIIWSAIIAFFTLIVMSFYPSMKEMGEGMELMMKSVPEGMRDAMGMSDSAWNSILGYYSTYYNLHIMVLIGIFGMSLASNSLAKEEKEHTSEFIYTRPLSRSNVYWTKFLSVIVMVLLTLVAQTILAGLGIIGFSEESLEMDKFLALHANGAGLTLFFTSIGFFLPTVFKKKINYMGIAVGTVFGGYLINALSKVGDSSEWIGYISPFYYVDFAVTDSDFTVSWMGIAGLLILSLGLVLFGAGRFNRKDFDT